MSEAKPDGVGLVKLKESGGERIPFLDYLRGVAILAVFLYHCVAPDYPAHRPELAWHGWLRDFHVPPSFWGVFPASLGWAGVAIFFVVSGFCIHLSHEKSRDKDLGVFFLRRFFRIYPPYLAALLIFALIFPWSKLDFSPSLLHTHSRLFYSLISLGGHLTLTHNFNETIAWGIAGSFWSIAVEVQLYLLYPLLLVLTRRCGWRGALVITGVIEISLRAFSALTHLDMSWLVLNPLFFWFSWTIGAALAEAHLKKQPLPFADRSLLFFPVLMLISYLIQPLSHFCFTLTALSTVYVMSYWLRNPDKAPSPARASLFPAHLRFAGLISYSIYLIHEPILRLVPHLLAELFPGYHVPYLLLFGICAMSWFFVLIPAYLFYRFLELPSIALGKRLIEARRRKKAGLAQDSAVKQSLTR